MEAKELRIGNHINSLGQKFNDKNQFQKWENHVVKVDIEILKNILIENKDFKYSPIPLTEKHLLEFGFDKEEVTDGFEFVHCTSEFNIIVRLFYVDSFKAFQFNDMDVYIEYVHQIQNLFLDLTREELTRKA